MSRLIAFGDIHGHARTLDALLKRVVPTTDDTLVFVGDYIDRGPRSAEVIQMILDLRKSNIQCVTLMGNHESALLDILGYAQRFPDGVIDGGEYMLLIPENGLPETVKSYGWPYAPNVPMTIYHRDYKLPPTHLEFFLELALYHMVGKMLFVHAHLDRFSLQERTANLAVREQLARDPFVFVNDRDAMFAPKVFPELIVHGHTPVHRVILPSGQRRPENEICFIDGRLNLDTGIAAHRTHMLSAVQLSLEGSIEQVWQEQDLDC